MRFHFQRDDGAGRELVRRANSLKLSLYKTDEGRVEGFYEIHGSVGGEPGGSLGGGGEVIAEHSNAGDVVGDLNFFRKLLSNFEQGGGR